jgi:hypothetical protein
MVSADPFHVEEKTWTYPAGMFEGRDEYPEAEPNDICPGTQTITCGDIITPAELLPSGDHDFFPFTLTDWTEVTLGTDDIDPINPDGTDTYIELWDGACTEMLDGDDDGGPGYYSLLTVCLGPGDYSAKVRGFGDSATGPYKLFMNCVPCDAPPDPPENDTCGGAEQFGYYIERCTSGTLSGTTEVAINDYSTEYGGCTGWSANGRDVVYYLDLEAGDTAHFIYTQLSADTSFYLITDCSDPNGSCVAGADGTYFAEPEEFTYVVTETGRYYLILDAYSTDTGGQWTMTYDITCPEPTPTQDTTWGQIKSMY